MGGEAQQRQARCDRNGGQVDLLPRGRVSTRIGAHITNESDACSLGCKHARGVCVRARAGGTNATWRGEVNALPKAPSTRSNAKRTKWRCQSWYPHENHAPRRRARTGEARGASRPPLCRPWPRRQHVGRRTHLAPSPPWPQSLTSRPTSRYPACLCAIRPLSGRSCKFSLWGQGGHRMRRWLSGGLWVG